MSQSRTPTWKAAIELRRHGFTSEVSRLLALKWRYEGGSLDHLRHEQRLRFVRWLVDRGRLSEGVTLREDERGTVPG